MRNIKNVLRTKRNSRGLFLQLSFCALFGIMTLFSGQTSAQLPCSPQFVTPLFSITEFTALYEGDLFVGGCASFVVTHTITSVTIDHINSGTGLQSLMFEGFGSPTVNIPPFTAGTYDPVTVTFAPGDTFTLRAASAFHAIYIYVKR